LIFAAIPLALYLIVIAMVTIREFATPGDESADTNEDAALGPSPMESAYLAEPAQVLSQTSDMVKTIQPVVPAEPAAPEAAPTGESASLPPALHTTDLAARAAPDATDIPSAPKDETQAAGVPEALARAPETTSAPGPAVPVEDSPHLNEADASSEAAEPDEGDDSILSGEPLFFPTKGSPKFTFDYRGRLWVEKKNKGFFRQLRRPQVPPDEPTS
jgi:hypothetical protein